MGARATLNSTQQLIVHRFVPGLRSDPLLRYSSGSDGSSADRLFVGQGDLDRACGLYCTVMAIMLTTNLPRRVAMGLLNETTSQYVIFKGLAKEMFFTGSEGETLGELAQAVRTGLRFDVIAGRHGGILHQVLSLVTRGTPVLLAVNDKAERYCHWVLVVGVETTSGGELGSKPRPTALLAIDPGSTSPVLRCFNWRLELNARKPTTRYLRFDDVLGRSRLVTCTEALVLRPARRTDHE